MKLKGLISIVAVVCLSLAFGGCSSKVEKVEKKYNKYETLNRADKVQAELNAEVN